MDKQQYEQWVIAVVHMDEQGREETDTFLNQLEQHDKQAAALARKTVAANRELAAYLKSKLQQG